jgi:zeta-carotene desaturase
MRRLVLLPLLASLLFVGPRYAAADTPVATSAPLAVSLKATSTKLANGLEVIFDEDHRTPIVTVNLWYDRPVLDDMMAGLPGRAFQWVFDKARIFGRERSHLSLVASGAAETVGLGNDALVTSAANDVAAAVPAARAARLLRGWAVRERRATFSLAPGQPERPKTSTPVSGLLLAGDWVDTGLPATIEGAVASGHWAAAAARKQ